jgi:beta-glucanase (GH16 family)
LLIIENKNYIRYAEDGNGSSMQEYFPAIWIKNLQKGFYSSNSYNRPILFWNN